MNYCTESLTHTHTHTQIRSGVRVLLRFTGTNHATNGSSLGTQAPTVQLPSLPVRLVLRIMFTVQVISDVSRDS